MSIPVIGLGAGGHAKVVIDILRLRGSYELVGLLDANPRLKGKQILETLVLGADADIDQWISKGVRHFFIGVGSTGFVNDRVRLFDWAVAKGLKPVSAIHPGSVIASSAKLGDGATIMAGAVINADAVLGKNVIVNTGAIVEHDCSIGDHAHVATGAKLASTVCVGERAHIGAGAVVRQCIAIGEGAIVGAGAVVVKDVELRTMVVGVPARLLRKIKS